MRKEIFTKEEHIKFANDLFHSAKILHQWNERISNAFRKTDPQYKIFYEMMHIITSKICNHMDSHYYKVDSDKNHDSPYYGTDHDERIEHKKPCAY